MGWPWLLLSGWGQLSTPAVLPPGYSAATAGAPAELAELAVAPVMCLRLETFL